ncbi:MAG: hypothetical protein R3183_05615 [Oleiphilaceae bacterium]|nr:hypothetical protein [Oleiphilaceae bacterium]
MKRYHYLVLALLIPFSMYSTWVMWEIGYLGIWQAGFASIGSVQILWDLAIACVLICSWLKVDAMKRGMNPYPWWIATLTTGTLAPLIYLLVRREERIQTISA